MTTYSMTKDSIIDLPNAHLRQRSKKVGIISPAVIKLAEGMKDATLNWEDNRVHEVGVALAAIQVDQALRLIVIRHDFDDKANRAFEVFINPEITKFEGVIEEDFEGCLSVPDIYGKVPRHSKVRVKALDINGKEIRVKAEGFLARVFQHEIDHTHGIVFIDHIKDKTKAFYRLQDDGQLKPMDYDKEIKHNSSLWD